MQRCAKERCQKLTDLGVLQKKGGCSEASEVDLIYSQL